MDPARRVKEEARACGFDLCGIAAVPGEEDARLREWLARGYHGAMAYMERRRDVRELLPGCRSVIALGVNYHVPRGPPPEGPRVSCYAQGEDYHRVLGRMLADYVPRLEAAFAGETFRACCDTAPVMEKAWAERAGIGWIGKNGCLISQRYGSWVFLAVVLATVPLPRTPHPDRCGSCDRCLHACPTGAFVAPRVIDARRCIPYLTIEQWKPIPRDLPVAPWAFGCDACQEVCPWNRRAKACGRPEFAPREHAPDPKAWVAMTGPEFRARYGLTALARPGRRGLARNALALLRDTGGLDDATRERARRDASALVRRQAET